MNRFTKDMATIDDMLPLLLFDFVQVCSHKEFQNLCSKIFFRKKKLVKALRSMIQAN